MENKEKVPIRSKLQFHIAEIFLLLITLTSVFIIYYTHERTSSSILEFSKTTIKRSNKIIEEKVSCLINTSKEIPLMISNSVTDLSGISADNKNLVKYLEILASNYEDLSAFYIGSIDGDYISSINVKRQNQKNFVIKSETPLPEEAQYALHIVNKNTSTPIESFTYFDKDFKKVAQESTLEIGYDPRRRPWFSMKIKQDQVQWSDIYIDAINEVLVITASSGIFDSSGKLIGVAAIDLPLETLSKFMEQIKTSKNGAAFILNKNTGRIIIPPPFGSLKKEASYQSLIALNKAYGKIDNSDKQDVIFEVEAVRYLAGFSSFQISQNETWLILVLAPLSDFFGDILSTQKNVIFISAFFLLIAAVFVILFSRKISRPISILAKEIDKIKNLKLDSEISVRSNIFEIILLDRSISLMRKAIRSFSKYVPKDVVEDLIKLGKDITLGGEKKDITIMFIDILGFTNLSEKLQPDEMMPLLSEYFDDLSKVILLNQGTIDKYIGDSIMALWSATHPIDNPWGSACKAALECHLHIQKINENRSLNNLPQFCLKFGIDTGPAIVGNIGTKERINFTAIGDVINTASRLQSVSPIYHCPIIISEHIHQYIRDIFITRPIGEISVKGKDIKIKIYELMALKAKGSDISATNLQIELSDMHTKAYESYETHKFKDALQLVELILQKHPEDEPAILLKKEILSKLDPQK